MPALVYVFWILTGYGSLLWMFSGLAIVLAQRLGREPFEKVRTVYHELRPFYLVLVLGNTVAWLLYGDSHPVDYFTMAMELLIWFLMRDVDDDDRWKRRRKRLTERVAEVGGRLTVVPGGAS